MALAPVVADAVDHEPAPGPERRRRFSGWTIVGTLVALVVVGPLLALPLSFVGGEEFFDPIARIVLPEAFATSVFLAVGVGVGSLVIGGGLALLVSFYDFPGRRILDWALVLPLAMPA